MAQILRNLACPEMLSNWRSDEDPVLHGTDKHFFSAERPTQLNWVSHLTLLSPVHAVHAVATPGSTGTTDLPAPYADALGRLHYFAHWFGSPPLEYTHFTSSSSARSFLSVWSSASPVPLGGRLPAAAVAGQTPCGAGHGGAAAGRRSWAEFRDPPGPSRCMCHLFEVSISLD